MADFSEQLQAILGNPEAMGQIAAIARSLTGGAPQEGAVPSQPDVSQAQDVDYVPVDTPPPGEAAPAAEPRSQSAPDLSALLGMLGNGGGMDLDPRLIQIALRLYSEYSTQDDEKTALLAALKPFLKEERREKLEKAEKLSRLTRVIRVALELLKEEGGAHV